MGKTEFVPSSQVRPIYYTTTTTTTTNKITKDDAVLLFTYLWSTRCTAGVFVDTCVG